MHIDPYRPVSSYTFIFLSSPPSLPAHIFIM